MPRQFYVRDEKPTNIPVWQLGFAIKSVLLFITGPLIVLLLAVVSVNIYPESRDFIRQSINVTTVSVIFFTSFLFFTGYLAYTLKSRRNVLKDLGFNPFPIWTTIKYLIAYPFVYFGAVLIMVSLVIAISNLLGYSLTSDQLAPNKERGSFNWSLFILATVFVPIIEEVLFRGILLPAFVHKQGWVKGSVYSSLIFSLLHGPAAPFIMIFSLYLSRMYYRTGSIIPGMILHMVNNAFVSLVLIL